MKLPVTMKEAEIIFKVWKTWHKLGYDPMWYGYEILSDETKIEIKKLKEFMKFMRDNHFAYHCPVVDGDGVPHGSGNFLYESRAKMNGFKDIVDRWEDVKYK